MIVRFAIGLLLAAALCRPGAATAVPAPPPPGAVQAAAYNAAQAEYGHWLSRLLAIAQPLQTSMAEVGNQAIAMTRSPDILRAAAELRPRVVQLVALADATEAQLAALDEPDFPALQLPSELRTGAIKAAVRRLNRTIRDAYQNYLPVLDAVARRDLAAAQRGAARSMVSMQEIVSSQLLIIRAQQVMLPPASSAWHATNVQVLFTRAVEVYAGAMSRTQRSVRGLAPDLRAIADELDATAARGSAQADLEVAHGRAMLSQAQQQGNVDAVAVLQRSIGVIVESGALFPLARDLAGLLRSQASRLPANPTAAQLLSAIGETYPIRDRIVAIVGRIGTGLSERH